MAPASNRTLPPNNSWFRCDSWSIPQGMEALASLSVAQLDDRVPWSSPHTLD
jgi:hypothetical protein